VVNDGSSTVTIEGCFEAVIIMLWRKESNRQSGGSQFGLVGLFVVGREHLLGAELLWDAGSKFSLPFTFPDSVNSCAIRKFSTHE
jgi:hypothetical protein